MKVRIFRRIFNLAVRMIFKININKLKFRIRKTRLELPIHPSQALQNKNEIKKLDALFEIGIWIDNYKVIKRNIKKRSIFLFINSRFFLILYVIIF